MSPTPLSPGPTETTFMSMRRATRVSAGILALVAMTFALAETVLASTCPPGMAMEAMDAPAAASQADSAHGADMARGATQGSEREPGGDDEPRCPLGPLAATQGCAGVASLPGHSAEAPAPSGEYGSSVFSEKTQQDLLSADALFHPPRA